MPKQRSFTKFENEALHDFRKKLNKAESTEDIKKVFIQTTRGLFQNIFQEKLNLEPDDILFKPDVAPHYKIADRIRLKSVFNDAWKHSDLPRVVSRFADSAMNRYKHIEKHPEKTDLKIRSCQ